MRGVYLAYAIDQDRPQARTLTYVRDWLRHTAAWVFDPGMGFFGVPGAQRSPAIRRINREALRQAGVVVALLPKGTVSIGVPMEIERAVAAGKPTLVISDAPSWMLEFDPHEAVLVVPEWNNEARVWLAEAIHRAPESTSEGLADPPRDSLPVLLHEDGREPTRGYADDAGLDLVVSDTVVVRPGAFVDIPCGISVQLPDWSWGLITGRSSTLRKRGLLVNQGVIDAGYRGPLFAGVWNMTDSEVKVSRGERIAQLIVMVNGTRRVEVEVASHLETGSRGDAGFGSTGT